MTRGRYPARAIRKALKTAEKRGEVRLYAHAPGRLADFSIVSPPMLAEVRIKPVRSIRCTPESLEWTAAEDLAALKMYPSSPQISRELWISSQKYFRRYFRVCDTGLVELGPDGQPLPADSPKTGPRRCRAGAVAPVPGALAVPATPGSPESPGPGSVSEVSPAAPDSPEIPAPESVATESHGPESPGPGSPAPSPAPVSPDPVDPDGVSPAPAHSARGTPYGGSVKT